MPRRLRPPLRHLLRRRRRPRRRPSHPCRRSPRRRSRTPMVSKRSGSQGDFVSKGTLIILVIMSMGSWYILFVKLWEQSELMRDRPEMASAFWKSPSLRDGAKKLKDGSAFRFIAETGLQANEHHEGTLTEHIDLNTGSRCRFSAPSTQCKAACRTAWRSSPRSVRRRRSSACSARCGAFSTRLPRSASPVRRRSTRSPVRSAKR